MTRALSALAFCLCLALGGCTSSDDTPIADPAPHSSSTEPEDLSTSAPPIDSGKLGGDSTADPSDAGPASKEPASKQPASKQPASKQPASKQPASKVPASKVPASKQPGTGPGSHKPDDRSDRRPERKPDKKPDKPTDRSIEVAGPTLDADYTEYFGNIYPGALQHCAYWKQHSRYDVRLLSMSVGPPLVLLSGCQPDTEDPATPACVPGAVLAAAGAGGCSLGVAIPDGTDLGRNYTPVLRWTMAVTCTDTEAEPCSAPLVVAAHPTSQQPVAVRWLRDTPLRYCGATGQEGGSGPPSDGCSAERAESSDSSPDSVDPSNG